MIGSRSAKAGNLPLILKFSYNPRMKIIPGLFLCLVFSIAGFGQKDAAKGGAKDPKEIWGFKVFSSCCRKQAGEQKNNLPVIADLRLDKTELTEEDPAIDTENSTTINVFADAGDADGDVLVYKYEVSGGKVIGQNQKVVWDLTSAKVGTYTIKVSVDDGCNFCGNTITKTVVIK